MKKLPFLFLLILSGCADLRPELFDPYDASQVTGLWYQWPDKSWVWQFDGEGLLTQSIFDFGVEVWSDKKAYSTNADTLKIQDLPNGQIKTYLIEFQDENNFLATEGQPISLSHKFVKF